MPSSKQWGAAFGDDSVPSPSSQVAQKTGLRSEMAWQAALKQSGGPEAHPSTPTSRSPANLSTANPKSPPTSQHGTPGSGTGRMSDSLFGPSQEAPEGWLQKTPCGYWVGPVFIPRAWLTDKFPEARLDQSVLWTFYYSRLIMAAIPLLVVFIAFIVSVSVPTCKCALSHPPCTTLNCCAFDQSPESRIQNPEPHEIARVPCTIVQYSADASCICSWDQDKTTHSNKWLPNRLDDLWGPFLCFSLISSALITDAYMLHPLQLCMRSPVLAVWDGTMKHFLGRRSKKLVVYLLGLKPDHFSDPPVFKPQHYQRTMYIVDRATEEEDERRQKVLSVFGHGKGEVIETDGGKRYLRIEGAELQEIIFDVRTASFCT